MAGASSLDVLGPNQVVTASGSVGGLTAPVDGRLRGPDFSLNVTGVSWPAQADGYEASSGQRLVVIELPVTALSASVDPSTLSLAVASPGRKVPLDFFSQEAQAGGSSLISPPSELTYVVSVPNSTHTVQLVASEGSFSQSFSLWSLERTGSAPAVLYADPSSAEPTVTVGTTLSVPITNSADGVTLSSNVVVSSATMTAFNPTGPSKSEAPSGSAYLTVSMSSGPPQLSYGDPNYGHFFSGLTPLPGSAVTLTPKGGTVIPATQSNPIDQANNPNASSDDGLVDATYSFFVPLAQPQLTLSIGPASTSGVEYTGFVGASSTPLEVGGPVTTQLSLPSLEAVAKQPTPPWVGKPNPPTGTASSGGSQSATVSGGGGGSGITIPIAILVVLLAAAGVFIARRRGFFGSRARPASTSTETVTSVVPDVAEDVVVDDVAEWGAANESTLRVNVLGPLVIEPRHAQITAPISAVVSFLALHDERPRTAGEIQSALWSSGADVQDVSKKTFHNYISQTRQAIGGEHLPEATARGYVLADFVTDLDRFDELLTAAAEARADFNRAWDLRTEALDLIRGEPFEGEDSEFLSWVSLDGTRSKIIRKFAALCCDHATLLLADGHVDDAELLLLRGLEVAPTERSLWQGLTAAMVQRGDELELRKHFEEAERIVGVDEAARLRELAGP
jgi:DNA-binding SARP family transcriptional activator